jgi:hypothetical protein
MKKVKSVIAFVWLVVLCGSAVWVEYNLVMRFGIMLSFVAGVCGLSVLLIALFLAPEGYEDENGFHIRARRKQARHARHVLAMSGHRS